MKTRLGGTNRLTGPMIVLVLAVFVAAAQNDAAAPSPREVSTEAIMPPSPVHQFRGILTMPEADREKFLAGKQPAQASVLRRKIIEYRNMPGQEREFRFRQLELCRLIMPLMRLEPSERAPRLDRIPEHNRSIVEKRLVEWDRLSPAQQKAVLDDKTVLSYFFRPEAEFLQRQMDVLNIMPPDLKAKMNLELADWRNRSRAERRHMEIRLNQLLRMNQADRDKVLLAMPPSDRAQLRSTLRSFQKLTPDQREKCIEGFGRLANLSATERDQFIFSAARWQTMSPNQRELWRFLVQRLNEPAMPPPLPTDALRSPVPPNINPLATNQ